MVRAWLAITFMFVVVLCGCGKSQPVEEKLVKGGTGIEQAKLILNSYLKGDPMGSEQMAFEDIIADIKQSDPRKAAILEKGFADIKRNPGNRAAKASELLKQL